MYVLLGAEVVNVTDDCITPRGVTQQSIRGGTAPRSIP